MTDEKSDVPSWLASVPRYHRDGPEYRHTEGGWVKLADVLAASQCQTELLAAAKQALYEMCHAVAPRTSYTDAVDALDAAISKVKGDVLAAVPPSSPAPLMNELASALQALDDAVVTHGLVGDQPDEKWADALQGVFDALKRGRAVLAKLAAAPAREEKP